MGSTEVEALDDGLEYNFENSDVEEGFSLQDEESTALDGATEGDKQEKILKVMKKRLSVVVRKEKEKMISFMRRKESRWNMILNLRKI